MCIHQPSQVSSYCHLFPLIPSLTNPFPFLLPITILLSILMLCCCCPKILSIFQTKSPMLSFYIGFFKGYGQCWVSDLWTSNTGRFPCFESCAWWGRRSLHWSDSREAETTWPPESAPRAGKANIPSSDREQLDFRGVHSNAREQGEIGAIRENSNIFKDKSFHLPK